MNEIINEIGIMAVFEFFLGIWTSKVLLKKGWKNQASNPQRYFVSHRLIPGRLLSSRACFRFRR